MAERILEVPQGRFELRRRPERPRSQLRAWDAADAYVVRHLAESTIDGPLAIINDSFGALACALTDSSPFVVADSAMSRAAIEENAGRNASRIGAVLSDVDALPGNVATVVVRVPKTLGLLEDQLHLLRPHLRPDTRILGAGMVRDIHTSTLGLFESILGPTQTSLAKQRARLIHATLDPDLSVPDNPWPRRWTHDGIGLVNRGGVFSATSIDIGTRFLLDHLPSTDPQVIVDLGCGNGVLGMAAARQPHVAEVHFIDASSRAIGSAELAWEANGGSGRATFHVAERMAQVIEPGTVDLVLNNPPFHEERAIGDGTAWDMFTDSHAALRSGGELRVVANQQLGHHARLRKIFGNCETVASNRKFVVLSAIR